MIPSTELRLNTMLRAMTESILPALDPSDSLAQEQAGLLMGHINALIQQQGKEHEIVEQEYEDLAELADHLLSIAEGGKETLEAKEKITRALDVKSKTALSLAVEQLIIASDVSDTFKKVSRQPILDYAHNSTKRGLDWFKPMGF